MTETFQSTAAVLLVAVFLLTVYHTARLVRVEEKQVALIDDFNALKQAEADRHTAVLNAVSEVAGDVAAELAKNDGIDLAGLAAQVKSDSDAEVAAIKAIVPAPSAPPAG